MNSFLFIIPCTPAKHQNKTRKALWRLCLETLIKQTHNNWKALIIGVDINFEVNDSRFITIPYEGPKEEKLQKATEYIISNNILGDYIIRLDDDDIINPNILKKISTLDFDLYVDKFQWFWHYESGKKSYKIWYWYPNTCIHKRMHALTFWGDFAIGDFQKFRNKAMLIENNHTLIHPYYTDKNVMLATKKHPIYLRSITNSSITALYSPKNIKEYYKRFGYWKKRHLQDFTFLYEKELKSVDSKFPKLSLWEKIEHIVFNFRCSRAYMKVMGKSEIF